MTRVLASLMVLALWALAAYYVLSMLGWVRDEREKGDREAAEFYEHLDAYNAAHPDKPLGGRSGLRCAQCAHQRHKGFPCPDMEDPQGSNSGCPCGHDLSAWQDA